MASEGVAPAAPALARPRARRLPWVAAGTAALGAVALAGWLRFPTYPNYDSYASLVWGRELLHGGAPSFDAYRAPTEHPLAVAFGAVAALAGPDADRLLVAATLGAFVALCCGLYRLAATAYGPAVGVAAAVLLCTRFDLPFLALRAYVDIPYLALVVWAGALEAAAPRRGAPVLGLLALAGLLRPEAWLLVALALAWCWPPASARERVALAALAIAAPLTWMLTDLAVTGHPFFSFTHTSGLAEELGRRQGAGAIPGATLAFLRGLDKAPVVAAGVAGVVLALAWRPWRARVPLALLAAGLATFVAVGGAGLAVVFRYLLLPAVMLLLFAGLAVAGWTLLAPGARGRRAWAAGAAAAVLAGGAYMAVHVTSGAFVTELDFRRDSHAALVALLRDPAVRAARRCGPVSLPNHRLVPEVRWILAAGPGDVIARSDRTQRRRARRGGVAVYATSPTAFRRYGYRPDRVVVALPLPGFRRAVTTAHFGAYVRCPA
jgi:hypothetical protein